MAVDFAKERDEILALLNEIKTSLHLPNPGENLDRPFSVSELKSMQERTQEILGRLKEKSAALAAESGMSKEELQTFMENPSNFSPEEWASIKEMKASVDGFRKELSQVVQAQEVSQDVENHPGKAPHHLNPKSKRHSWIPT